MKQPSGLTLVAIGSLLMLSSILVSGCGFTIVQSSPPPPQDDRHRELAGGPFGFDHDGELVGTHDGDEIFLLRGGTKHLIPNGETYHRLFGERDRINWDHWHIDLHDIPNGESFGDEARLVHTWNHPDEYYLENHHVFHHVTHDALDRYQFNREHAETVHGEEIHDNEGEPIR